jgi:hypothetical protein
VNIQRFQLGASPDMGQAYISNFGLRTLDRRALPVVGLLCLYVEREEVGKLD